MDARRLATPFLIGLALLAFTSPAYAHQPAINVACGDIPALRAAIAAANDAAQHPGDDTIALGQSCNYDVTDEYAADTSEAFPPVTSTIRILGNGSKIERTVTDRFRLFNVGATGLLLIDDLTLRMGIPAPGGEGGAVFVDGDLIVRRSVFDDNRAGAIFIGSSGGASFFDTTFSDNTANGGQGGAVWNRGLLYLERTTLTNNDVPQLPGQFAYGGAISNDGEATLYKSSITGSEAHVGGAIGNTGDLLMIESTISGNEANFGTALEGTGRFTISNSTIAENFATLDGAAGSFGDGAIVDIDNSTIASNRASRSYGGILNENGGATITVSNSIIASNTNGNCGGAITDAGYNIGYPAGTGCPATFLTGSPGLAPLGFYGGPTKTMKLGTVSAARDQVPTSGAGCQSKDQRAFTRPGGSLCDIGAVESQPPVAPGGIVASANPNLGAFSLSWTAASDLDLDSVSYILESRDADDPDWSVSRTGIGGTSTGFSSFAPEREGRIHYRLFASDGAFRTEYGSSGEIVVDRTAPLPPQPAADRSPEYVDGDGDRWFADSVTISFTPSTDPNLADGSAGNGIASTTEPVTFSTTGPFTAAGTSTDAAGNVSAGATYAGNVDSDAPAVAFSSCPAQVILAGAQSIDWTASDRGAGVDGATSGSVALDTAAIGTHSVNTPTVSDHVAHHVTASCDYSVIWDFNGFRAPLKTSPDFATVAAGQPVRVTFTLGGDQGLDVLAAAFPQSAGIDCSSTAALESGAPTSSSAPLSFSSGSGVYTYSWVTSKAWKGTCRQFILKLADGTFHLANVRFK